MMTNNPLEQDKKRKLEEAFKDDDVDVVSKEEEEEEEEEEEDEIEEWVRKRPKYNARECNENLSIRTKRAALFVAPSVVSLISYSDDKVLSQGSGIIIECDDDTCSVVVLTSAKFIRQPCVEHNSVAPKLKVVVKLSRGRSFVGNLCAHDFQFNIAAVRFKSDTPLLAPTLTRVDDSLHLHQTHSKHTSFHIARHSTSTVLTPGDAVIAVGRYFAQTFELMAAPGKYCLDRCGNGYDCQLLFNSTCLITKCGDGGPLVNLSGEVIGVAFYDLSSTPFMPINLAHKWWERYKICGELRWPSLGMYAISFHTSYLKDVYNVIQKFPTVSKGVYVEKVLRGSSAESAGLQRSDVIIECAGKVVPGFLEFMEILWDHIGQPVDLVVVRADDMKRVKMMVAEIASNELKFWPSLEVGHI